MTPETETTDTLEKFESWVASREEAGLKIDIETCEITWWWGLTSDPYGLRQAKGDLLDEEKQIQRLYFVRSPETQGWVCSYDFPSDKIAAMHDRFAKEGENDWLPL